MEGEKSDEFLQAAKEYYCGWGYTDEEADAEASRKLLNIGYLAESRRWRRTYENDIKKNFADYLGAHPLTSQGENEQMMRLREKCYFLNDPESALKLAAEFPAGNYLYHGTNVKQAIEIMDSGALMNAKTLQEREEKRFAKEGGEKRMIKINSGYEGISWNFNEIGALPGDRYHLVGFLASPNVILNEQLQLAIPSRPAPNELILINGDINADRYYSFKTQQELQISIGFGESNSVWSNLVQLSLHRKGQTENNLNIFTKNSMLAEFSEKNISDEQTAELLRSKYSVKHNGIIEFYPELLQQVKDDIPVGAVWLQALIDTGRINNVSGFEDAKTVNEAISRITGENYKAFLKELNKERFYLENVVKEEDDKVTSIEVPISEMYLVVPDSDLNKWLRTIARTKEKPKGVIVYGHNTVRLENFASKHRGSNQEFTDLLRKAIPKSEGYIDYEKDILGEEITDEKLVGYRRHVIGEQYLKKRRSLQKDGQKLALGN